MRPVKNSPLTVQLMRAALLSPFLAEMESRKIDASELLRGSGLSKEFIESEETQVSANQVHQFTQRVATASGDPYFCWKTGWALDHASYPLFAVSLARCHSLLQLFTEIVLSSSLHATATRFELHIEGTFSHFRAVKTYRPDQSPCHTDAYSAGMMASLIARYAGNSWKPGEVSLELSEPDLVPRSARMRRIRSTRSNGTSIRFPTSWLLVGVETATNGIKEEAPQAPPQGLLPFIRGVLQAHLGDPDLKAPDAARLCGFSMHDINRHLAAQGSTLASLIDEMKKDTACDLLAHSDNDIAAIGKACGYPDPTSFSRAFRRWTGTSARNYRESRRK